jgi:phospholipase D1/2
VTGATARAARLAQASSPADAILQPGKNCWCVERAHKFHCVQDGADYFRLVREALLGARNTVFILGWDILATVNLLPDAQASDAPTRLDELLAFVARRRPDLHCYILIWDYAALYTLERDPFSRWRLGWTTPRRIRFGYDDRHPVGGSHHQKIVVVDDQLAFCGGIDLTGHRWDTSAHRIVEPARTSRGEPYEPYHEVQAMVDGPAAARLGELARDRWRALGEESLPALGQPTHDLWPSEVRPDLTDVDVAIARTMPGSEAEPSIRECEALFVDSIARAQRTIYIESQYFTNDTLAGALAARLREPEGPEVIVVAPKECHGWLEKSTMGTFRNSAFRAMLAADAHRRLRLVYPAASRAQDVPTFIHSKVMIVDEELVRIGSANFSRRSMGVDTECDLAVEAGGDPRVAAGIRQIRDRLLAEHLSLPVDAIAAEVERAGSIRALIDARESAEHTLVRIELAAEDETPPSEALRAAADPDEPVGVGSSVAQLVPPADATNRFRTLRVPMVAAIVLAAAAMTSSALVGQSNFQDVHETLGTIPSMHWTFWIGSAAVVVANLLMIPLELSAIVAAVLFGPLRGGLMALLGSLVAAAIGYAAGRAMGAGGLARWMSRRSYRSVRQLGAHGIVGVVVLRLASVASAGSIHLLCGAGRVPFATYMIGTVIGLSVAITALSALGALLRHSLLYPSLVSGAMTIGAALLFIAVAAALRTFLLARQFAPSIASHRNRAEFG